MDEVAFNSRTDSVSNFIEEHRVRIVCFDLLKISARLHGDLTDIFTICCKFLFLKMCKIDK